MSTLTQSDFTKGQAVAGAFFVVVFILAFATFAISLMVPELSQAGSMASSEEYTSSLVSMVLSLVSLFVTFQF